MIILFHLQSKGLEWDVVFIVQVFLYSSGRACIYKYSAIYVVLGRQCGSVWHLIAD
jgi:hypothetical protein